MTDDRLRSFPNWLSSRNLSNEASDESVEALVSAVRSRYEPGDGTSLEGLTWPDTYFIGASETETQILQKIVTEFDKRATAVPGFVAPDARSMFASSSPRSARPTPCPAGASALPSATAS